MTPNGILQVCGLLAVLLLLVKPLGSYMARVYAGQPRLASRLIGPFERLIYRVCGVNPEGEMGWKEYAGSLLLFHAFGFFLLYLLQRSQALLPLNPQNLPGVPPLLAFNTAVSFITNTNWQAYAGETTMSTLTQMLGLTVQNFASAASGMAVLAAFIRGLARKRASTIGNYWVDMVRTVLYILLPLSIALSILLVSQGVVQTLAPAARVPLLQGTIDGSM